VTLISRVFRAAAEPTAKGQRHGSPKAWLSGGSEDSPKLKMKSDCAVRRKARRRLWSLMKFRESSKWFFQYGPYALVDERNTIAFQGLDLDEARHLLDSISLVSTSS
jgi:hypothetical protein